jgi:NACalpha-BTF3-like transcription factor
MPEIDDVTLGEVFRAVKEIRVNMVSKDENRAVLDAMNARISSVETNLANRAVDAGHDHAELEAASRARNAEVKQLIAENHKDVKLLIEKDSAKHERAIDALKSRSQTLEDEAAKRKSANITQLSLIGVAMIVSLFGSAISKALGLGG